jgi:calcineurin-like phosphoesterase family protein
MSSIWFTSDEHYGHRNIIDFCNRPFVDTDDMRESLIDNHNSIVKKGDRVYHLGDMFWRTVPLTECLSTVKRLNGQHFYIYGNHEEAFKSPFVRNAFIWCRDLENLHIDGYPNIMLCHYAMRTWNGSHKGSYQLYGHTHGELPPDGSLSCDVGVDAWNYKPVSLEQVEEKMKAIKSSRVTAVV